MGRLTFSVLLERIFKSSPNGQIIQLEFKEFRFITLNLLLRHENCLSPIL